MDASQSLDVRDVSSLFSSDAGRALAFKLIEQARTDFSGFAEATEAGFGGVKFLIAPGSEKRSGPVKIILNAQGQKCTLDIDLGLRTSTGRTAIALNPDDTSIIVRAQHLSSGLAAPL